MLPYSRWLKTKARSLRNNPTNAEPHLWQRLRRKQIHGVQFYRQKPIGRYIADYYAPTAKLVVELDGAHHLERGQVEYDRQRTKELEQQGTFLTVTDVHIRYRQPARYDDMIRVRCWVRDLASRRVIFGYAVERAETGELLATAETSLIALNPQQTLSRLPEHVCELLEPTADPVRL